ncbi:MAG: cell division protein FtsA [candidate division WOR-3 bacterium]
MANQELVVGCDLGSYKVVGLVGVKEEDKIKVLGWGEAESRGIEKGVIINIEKASESIEEALKMAFRMAGKDKKEIMVSISGEHAEGKIEKGFVVIQTSDNEIRREDVKKVIEQAKTRSYSEEKEVIFVYPNHFIVDDQKGIKEPVGMIGVKLEVEAFVLKAKKNILKTIEKCFKRVGFEIEGYITQPLASSFAVLDEEEKSQGCVLIDIGKGTTDLAIWKDGGIQYTSTLKIGGDFLAGDLATCLKIPKIKAEELLKKYSFAHPKFAEGKETVLIERTGGRPPIKVTPEEYAQITEARLIEIFRFCELEILKWGGKENLIAGIVLTGGYANLEGIEEIAEEVFKLSVIKKGAKDVIGLSNEITHPSYSAAIGVLKIGIMEREKIKKMKKKSFFRKLIDFLEKI